MTQAQQDKIRKLLATGELEGALVEWVQGVNAANDAELIKTSTTLQSRYSRLETNKAKGIISAEAYNLEYNQILNDLLDLLNNQSQSNLLHLHHSYTCDRSPQTQAFNAQLQATADQRVQFFYLYGGDLHLHTGMFRRIVLDLEGRSLDYLNAGLAVACKVKSIEITFEGYEPLEDYKTELLKGIFAAFALQPNQLGPLLSRKLTDIVQHSPQVRDLTGMDYVCVYINIDKYSWYSDHTPEAARWFMEEFCNVPLNANQPRMLFFFSVEFEEEDADLAQDVRDKVDDNPKIQALPELNKVALADIDRWLGKHKKIQPDPRERKKILQERFNGAPDHYMIDVQETLQELIKSYNDGLG
ncbi:hypothetical protein [Haliscomenobacter hydrossis]|uniref:Uncharacterized protein n=1 Tax=Haliscomenobacter hydrossis (strain ATCC 27775 / DSM 1100 / LMG 10767 / O) TaxID=760192 RepID=F4KXH5_HALH1|nr:hypothetical protein [Haliscomenobacter hydrossis]AEE50346.1 hypothetical protein Halhy_2473 [Haliscomenobacter hydrossis DSM 1100]